MHLQERILNKVADMASLVLTRDEMGYQPKDRRRKPRFDTDSAYIAADLALEVYAATHTRFRDLLPGRAFVVNEIWARPKRYEGLCGASDGSAY